MIGSAHLDILSNVTGDVDAIDKIGGLSIQFGGTAYNLLINLSRLGHHCRFASGMKRSPFTGLILDNLKHVGVDLMVQQRDDVPLGGFNAHLADGDIYSAVSSMPVERFDLSDSFLIDAMSGMDAVVFECNLSEIQIEKITRLASKLDIPFFAGAVSEEKALRLLSMRHRASAVFMNVREALYLVGNSLAEGGVAARVPHGIVAAHENDAATKKSPAVASVAERKKNGLTRLDDDALTRLQDKLNAENIVVTAGKEPVCVASGGTIARLGVHPIDLPNGGNYLGAGDLFMALTIDHALGGSGVLQSAQSAIRHFRDAAFSENCNMEDTDLIEKRMDEVDTMAKFDAMTGLNNRRAGQIIIDNEISRMRRLRGSGEFSLLIFDIDKFKTVNDTYGHAEGDLVIAAVAKCLKECARDIDTGIRWGGEEFICALPMTNLQGAMVVAERIRTHIENTVSVAMEGHPLRTITVSIGVAEYCDGMNAKALVELADKGLYAAKEGGRNRVCAEQDIGELYTLSGEEVA